MGKAVAAKAKAKTMGRIALPAKTKAKKPKTYNDIALSNSEKAKIAMVIKESKAAAKKAEIAKALAAAEKAKATKARNKELKAAKVQFLIDNGIDPNIVDLSAPVFGMSLGPGGVSHTCTV